MMQRILSFILSLMLAFPAFASNGGVKKEDVQDVLIQEMPSTINTINNIRRISSTSIEATRKQLIANTNRAENVLPYLAIGATGIFAYLILNAFEKKAFNVNDETCKEAWDEFKKKAEASAKAKSEQDNKADAADKEKAKSVNEQAKEKIAQAAKNEQGWISWFGSGLWNGAKNIGHLIKTGTPTYIANVAIGYMFQSQSKRIIKYVESFSPSIVNRVINYINVDPTFDWFISSRTKFNKVLTDLKRYVENYTQKIVIDYKINEIQSKFKFYQDAAEAGQVNQDMLMEMGEFKKEYEMLIQQRENSLQFDDKEMCKRISLECSYLVEQMEKILGFIAYNDRRLVYAKIDPKKKLDGRAKNSAISKSLISFTNMLIDITQKEVEECIEANIPINRLEIMIDKERKQRKDANTLQFAQKFSNIISQIAKEINSFSTVEAILYEDEPKLDNIEL